MHLQSIQRTMGTGNTPPETPQQYNTLVVEKKEVHLLHQVFDGDTDASSKQAEQRLHHGARHK
jgi:hypothetical protein